MIKFYNISILNRLVFAAISGALVYPVSFLDKVNVTIFADVSIIDVIIGAVFAILVMVPFQKRTNWLKSVLMIVASVAIYTFMVKLAVSNYKMFSFNLDHELAITVSGGLGALLIGIAIQLFAPLKLRITVYPLLIILGLVAGYIFSITIDSNSNLINSIGFIVWQVLVCLAVAVSKK